MKEDFNRSPGKSDTNPNGIPERTLREVRAPEFGPVTWGAYEGATSGIRSLTDRYLRDKLGDKKSQEDPEETPESTPSEEPAEATPAGAANKRKEPLFGLPPEEEETWRL